MDAELQKLLNRIQARNRRQLKKINEAKTSNKISAVDKVKKPEVKEPVKMGADYLGLIEVYRATHKTTYADAVRAINRIVPEAEKRASLERATLAKQTSNPPRTMSLTPDGKSWKEMMDIFTLEKGFSRIEALRRLDKLYPGLRQGFVDQQNQ